MQKKAFIYDFDNTVFPVPSIGDRLFASLFDLIEDDAGYNGDLKSFKDAVMRQPFQGIAKKFKFTKKLTVECVALLSELTYDGPLKPYEDFDKAIQLPGDKYLVTTGFYKLQKSKIDASGVRNDFRAVYIIDPATTAKVKKDIFEEIVEANGYHAHEVMIIGDDPDSEIKAGNELNIDTVLYDKHHRFDKTKATYKIENYQQLVDIVHQISLK